MNHTKEGSTQILHLAVDASGMPVRFVITQQSTTANCTQASCLIGEITTEYLLAGRGHDSDAVVEQAKTQEMSYIIPPVRIEKHKEIHITKSSTICVTL